MANQLETTMASSLSNGSTDDNTTEKPEECPILEEYATRTKIEATKEAERWWKKASEFRAESERLRRQARSNANRANVDSDEDTAIPEADQLDQQARLFTLRAEGAWKLSHTLAFETHLLRLRRSDPTLTCVTQYHPSQWKEKGEALLPNTVVSKLKLDLTEFLSEDPPKLGDLQDLITPTFDFISKSKSLRDVDVYDDPSETAGFSSDSASFFIIGAIANSKNIERLRWMVRSPPDEFAFPRLLRNVQTLREFIVKFDEDVNYSEANIQEIVSAFSTQTKLESLTLYLSGHQELIVRILSTALPQLTSLTDLSLGYDEYSRHYEERCITAVSRYIKSANCTLVRLGTVGMRFSSDEIRRILYSTVDTDRDMMLRPLPSISELSFAGCKIRAQRSALAAFLQTRTTDNKHNIFCNSALQVLCIGREPRSVSKQMASALVLRKKQQTTSDSIGTPSTTTTWYPTVGSQLRSLRFHRVYPNFLYGLRDNAPQIKLRRLELWGVSWGVCKALSTCLLHLTFLHELSVQNVADGHAHWIVRGLQRNHSIVLVSFINEDGSSDFNDAERRLIQAYCDRNQFLASLWPKKDPNDQNSTTSNEGSSTSTTSSAVTVSAETLRISQHPIQVQAPLLMHPGLLKAAQDMPQARSAMLMRGLFKMKRPKGSA